MQVCRWEIGRAGCSIGNHWQLWRWCWPLVSSCGCCCRTGGGGGLLPAGGWIAGGRLAGASGRLGSYLLLLPALSVFCSPLFRLSLSPFILLSLYWCFVGLCVAFVLYGWCEGAEVRACTFAASLWVRGIRFASLYAVIRFLPGLLCAFLVLCAIVAAVMLENSETALNNYLKINFFHE